MSFSTFKPQPKETSQLSRQKIVDAILEQKQKNKDKAKRALTAKDTFIIGDVVHSFVPTDSTFFDLTYHHAGEVHQGYLQITPAGQIYAVEVPDDNAEAKPYVNFSFENDKISMTSSVPSYSFKK